MREAIDMRNNNSMFNKMLWCKIFIISVKYNKVIVKLWVISIMWIVCVQA